jgi:hypothetical protein
MQLLVIRGSGGVVVWTKSLTAARAWNWVCSRDQFSVAGPADPSGAEQSAVAIATHSATLVGAISQIVQVDL